MKITLDINRAYVLRRACHPDVVSLTLENGEAILGEGVSEDYAFLCDGRFDLDFKCPHGTAEMVLMALGLGGSELEVTALELPKPIPIRMPDSSGKVLRPNFKKTPK